MKPSPIKIGDVFGRLVVTQRAPANGRHGMSRVVCECGAEKSIENKYLLSGATRSCGCLADEVRASRFKTHGMTKTPTWTSWRSMHKRCLETNGKDFKDYGARGITICERWRGTNGFENFLADMGERLPGMSLDRIDVNGNYEPGNCRWATAKEQSWNKRGGASEKHCARGHEYTTGNTRIRIRDGKQCRVCRACERSRYPSQKRAGAEVQP